MDIKIGTVVQLSVVCAEHYNGKGVYRVFYKGRDYRVKRYSGQPFDKKTVSCMCVGEDYSGWPKFEQTYFEILKDLYQEGETYPFKLSSVCTDSNTGAPYYQLEDENGLRHRLYMPRNSSFKPGDSVLAKGVAVNQGFLSMELVSGPPKPTSHPVVEIVDQQKSLAPVTLDFSKLNPTKDATLRDYQVENKRKIYEAWQSYRSVMLQMPTGTGKTRLFVSIARDIFDYGASIKKTFKVLILAHRKELIEQISDHLGQKYRLAHGLIISQNIEQKKYSMQVGSVPTLNRRLERWEDKNFDVIIIDEAHHVKAKSYKKIIDLFPNAKILGVTATPYRLNHAGFRPEFDELIVSPSVAEFIKRGYLCEYDYYSIRPNSELQKEIDRMKLDFEGDYKESEMMDVMDRDVIRADILDTYQRYAGGKKAIVYTISRDHNVHLAEKFKAAGIVSAAIDSETPKEKRDELVGKFRRGEIQVLFNVNIFSEGFDCPDVEVIQLARPTKSLSLYLQQVGRGLRPADGKEKLLILDNVGLYNKFGFPSARRKWRYHFEGQDVDESPSAHKIDREEEREVKDIFEGSEEVAMLHTSMEEEVGVSDLDSISRNYKDNFIEFCSRELDSHTVQGYVRNIENTIDHYVWNGVNSSLKSLFNTVDQDELEAIRVRLFKDVRFKALNNDKHHVFSAAFNKYRAFAKWFNEHKSDAPALPEIVAGPVAPDMPVNYRDRFKVFLKKDKYSDSGAEQVIKHLTQGVDLYIKKFAHRGHKTVFETSDVERLTKYYNTLMHNITFVTYNKLKSSRPAAALQKYIAFAKTMETSSVSSTPAVPVPEAKPPVELAPQPSVEYHPFKNEFEEYLALKGINRPSARKYVTMLTEKVNPMIRRLIEPSFISILANDNIEVVRTMYELLVDKKEYKDLNEDNYNAPDVAFRKYIDFLKERNLPTTEIGPEEENHKSTSSDVVPPAPADVVSAKDGDTATITEIEASIKELDNLENLLKKNNLPVNSELEERRQRLRALRASLLHQDLVIYPIEERMKGDGLIQTIAFTYTKDTGKVEIISPTIDLGVKQNLEDLKQIISLMSKNHLSVPKDVRDRKATLEEQVDLGEKIHAFAAWIPTYVASLRREGVEIESIRYSPEIGMSVKTQDEVSNKPQQEVNQPSKPFVLDKTPIPATSGKAILRVTLEDGTVLENENASETFIAVIEHIGIQKVKQLNIRMYYRPIIDTTPHPRYRTQCKKLSDGEYLLVLSTTERKAQIINSIANHYGLSIKAELIENKKR